MIKTITREYEEYIINLASKYKEDDYLVCDTVSARQLLYSLRVAFDIITEYDNIDHRHNFEILYMGKNNIRSKSIVYMCKTLYLSERTLLRYREKYCKVIVFILSLYNIKI